jgi:hypothetical protein
MLTAYTQTVVRLLKNDQTFAKVNTFDLYDWINIARGQIAGESECIRVYSTLAVNNPTQQYPFSAIAFPAGTQGVAAVQAVRDITWQIAGGAKKVYSREWEWFNRYILSSPVPVPGPPKYWAQYGQGTQGTVFVNIPDSAYTLNLDTACLPIPLVDDTTPEAIPRLWTDAVPYYAAYMAFLQQGDKDNADNMMRYYGEFMQRARAAATPSELPHQFAGTSDPTVGNKLGIQQRRSAA